MAIPGTIQLVSDNFNRANVNPIAGNWTDAGGSATCQIFSNAVTPTNYNANDTTAIWNTWTGGDDHYSQVEVTATGSAANAGFGVCVRHHPTAATNTFYRVVIDGSGNWELGRFLTGTHFTLTTGTTTYTATKALGLLIVGSTLSCWYGGVQIGTNQTDINITTGVPAISYSSAITGGSMDNWDAGVPAVAGAFKNALKPSPFKPSGR